MASLIVAHAMSDIQLRMRKSYHDAASWVREGLMVRRQKPRRVETQHLRRWNLIMSLIFWAAKAFISTQLKGF